MNSRSIEIIEKETKSNGESMTQEVKLVGMNHMMKIFNDINPMTNSNFDKNSMPLMQKILLCTVLLCTKEMRVKEILLSKV